MKSNGLPSFYLEAFVLFLSCSSLIWRDAASIGQPPGPRTTFTIVENQTEGETVGRVVQSGGAHFSFVEDSILCNEFFTIDANTSIIRTVGLLDREAIVKRIDTDQVYCFVQYFNLSARIQQNTRITINVLDINDEVPQFNNLVQPHVLQVTENVAAPTPLLRLEPIDNDSGANKTVRFNITSGNTDYFKIMRPEGDNSDTETRLLFLRRELDFEIEQNRMFNLTIRISDMGSPMNTFDQQIVIVLNNSLDEPPTFPTTSFLFEIPENHPIGRTHPFANVTAANAHQMLGSIFYHICEESGCPRMGPAGVILVNQVTGGLYLNSSLDYDANDAVRSYSFYVTALNPGTRSSQNVYVSVTVLSINDNAPYVTCTNIPNALECPDASNDDVKFTEVDFDIVENSGMARLWLEPHDNDNGAGDVSTIEYNITSDPQIDVTSATVFGRFIFVEINESLDREVTPNVTILFTIFNTVLPYLSSTLVIRVHVGDINDNAPIFSNALYSAYVSEGSPRNKEVLRVEASDSDAGSNADITYAIVAVDKRIAKSWFKISPTTGVITVNGTRAIDYHKVEGVVVLNVTATDNGRVPLSSLTTVEVKVVPAITFSTRSHQAFASYNLAAADLNSVLYVEFQTSSGDGLLLYQQEAGNHFSLSLEERRAVLKHRGVTKRSDATFVDNTWHSVHVKRSGEGISVVMQRVESGGGVPAVVLGAQIQNCTNVSEESLNREEFLFIGGYNPFSTNAADSSQLSTASDFVGSIRNVIFGGSQVNLRCPQEEENTLIGEQRSNLCRDEALQCHPLHSTRCVDYAEQSVCSCLGGFPSQVCRASTQQDNYAPIRLRGTGHVSINLSYSFLYDLEMLKRSAGDGLEESDGPGVGARRKRKQISDPESSMVTLQKVEIRFRPVEVGDSVLLQAENKDFVHRLTIQETGTQYAVKYEVFDKLNSMTTPSVQILISNLHLKNRTEYQVSITYTNIQVITHLTDGTTSNQNNYLWASKRTTLFVEQSDTTLSIGGAPGETDFFVGCISSLKIDELELPLSGLAALSAAEGGFSNDSVDAVEPYCDLCDLTVCPSDTNCLSNGYGGTECTCPPGHIFDGSRDICVLVVVTPPGGGLSTSAFTAQTTYYIAGGTAGGVLLAALLILLLIFAIRVKQVKHGKRKRTYSVTAIDGILPPQRTSKTVNEYVRVEPRRSSPNDDSLTCITTTFGRPENHERGSSVSTFQEHADDADPDLDDPPRLQRRKSTVSAESGIRTDTERESSLRGTSRMDDSGTDYTPQESESDDVISSCFMEPVSSPAGIRLVESASSLMGVPIKAASPTVPLTPQERKLITPLRPDSIRLSMSENDHHDTDIETDFSLHNLPPIHHNILMQRETDSDASTKVSDISTPKWYKASTASDNERERERALKNRAYYPTRSQSMPYQPHPPRPKTAFGAAAPEYVPPPSISMRKSASPVFPRSPTRRLPPTMMQADSPLTRKTRKYENYPLPPYSMHPPPPPPPSSEAMRERNRHGVLPSYENHCLQHQISAPQYHNRDKNHLSAQQGRHVYFAKSSQMLHYPLPPHEEQNSHSNLRQYYTLASTLPSSLQYRQNRSFSSGDAPPSEREQTQFQDLKNVSTINPISYWEMQDRLKPAVDQVDPYQVLSEPYIQFEDVSTDLSVSESQPTLNAEDGPDHEVFESQGGGEGAADIGPGCLSRLEDHEISSVISESQSIREGITHFPSADCSNEYTATINGTSSSSGDSTPKFQPLNGFIISSQQSFDV